MLQNTYGAQQQPDPHTTVPLQMICCHIMSLGQFTNQVYHVLSTNRPIWTAKTITAGMFSTADEMLYQLQTVTSQGRRSTHFGQQQPIPELHDTKGLIGGNQVIMDASVNNRFLTLCNPYSSHLGCPYRCGCR